MMFDRTAVAADATQVDATMRALREYVVRMVSALHKDRPITIEISVRDQPSPRERLYDAELLCAPGESETPMAQVESWAAKLGLALADKMVPFDGVYCLRLQAWRDPNLNVGDIEDTEGKVTWGSMTT